MSRNKDIKSNSLVEDLSCKMFTGNIRLSNLSWNKVNALFTSTKVFEVWVVAKFSYVICLFLKKLTIGKTNREKQQHLLKNIWNYLQFCYQKKVLLYNFLLLLTLWHLTFVIVWFKIILSLSLYDYVAK